MDSGSLNVDVTDPSMRQGNTRSSSNASAGAAGEVSTDRHQPMLIGVVEWVTARSIKRICIRAQRGAINRHQQGWLVEVGGVAVLLESRQWEIHGAATPDAWPGDDDES